MQENSRKPREKAAVGHPGGPHKSQERDPISAHGRISEVDHGRGIQWSRREGTYIQTASVGDLVVQVDEEPIIDGAWRWYVCPFEAAKDVTWQVCGHSSTFKRSKADAVAMAVKLRRP
jgi:hypothetical protein